MHVIKATVGRYCESLSHHFDQDKNSIKKMHVTIFSKGKECNVGFFRSISVTHGHESGRKSWHKCVPTIAEL